MLQWFLSMNGVCLLKRNMLLLKLQDGVKKWEGDDDSDDDDDDDDDNDSQEIQHAQSMAKSEVTTLASPR